MKIEPPTDHMNRFSVNRSVGIRPKPGVNIARSRQENAEQRRILTITILGQPRQLPLVSIILVRKTGRTIRMRVNDTGDKVFILGPFQKAHEGSG
ncbi:MAG: hypothetical protein WBO35_05105 [Candidatus Saccharimonadales bacterium]